jgi:sulfur carrier protein ThiS
MNVYVNEHQVSVDRRERISVHDLCNTLNLGMSGDHVEVHVNGEHVDRSKWLKYGVQAEDEVHIRTLRKVPG